MKCKVDGCERDVMYKSQGVCQMHYFRMMRYGTYELTRVGKAKQKIETPNGYIKVKADGHILSDSRGYAFEHRLNLYNQHNGNVLSCEFCGAYWNWRPYLDHVDHIDKDKKNNEISNLRPLCNACNTRRTKRTPHKEVGRHSISFDGKIMTPEEWSRQPGISVRGCTIARRIKNGWKVHEALYTPSKTFKGHRK